MTSGRTLLIELLLTINEAANFYSMDRQELLAKMQDYGASLDDLGNLLMGYFNQDWSEDVKEQLGIDAHGPGAWKHVVTLFVKGAVDGRDNKQGALDTAEQIDELLNSGASEEDLEWLLKEAHAGWNPRPSRNKDQEFTSFREAFEALRDELRKQANEFNAAPDHAQS